MDLIQRRSQGILIYAAALIAMGLAVSVARANDLKDLYGLALTRDASLQAAGFSRDAAIEARPQARAQWLPQVSAVASAERERVGVDSGQSTSAVAADCAIGAAAGMQHCYGTARALGINMSQTLWSFQAFSQLKEANFQAAAAEAAFRSAQQNLLLRVAQAYFAILSAADQLATNRAERDAR
jgi:outer membrane protein